MAVWYCDDGSHGTNQRESILHTHGFTEADCYLLINALYHKFNVRSRLRCQTSSVGKPQPIIAIGAREGYDSWHAIVDPFIRQFDCFRHKLGRSKKESRKGELVNTSKLTEKDVRNIRKARKLHKVPIKELAEKYSVGSDCISDVVHQRTWKHVRDHTVAAPNLSVGGGNS